MRYPFKWRMVICTGTSKITCNLPIVTIRLHIRKRKKIIVRLEYILLFLSVCNVHVSNQSCIKCYLPARIINCTVFHFDLHFIRFNNVFNSMLYQSTDITGSIMLMNEDDNLITFDVDTTCTETLSAKIMDTQSSNNQ